MPLQRWCGANRYIHCSEQHLGASQGGRPARRVPDCEEFTHAEASYGPNGCKYLQKNSCLPGSFAATRVIDHHLTRVSFHCRNSTTSATGWYKILSTFSPTMPILNEICLKRGFVMFSKATLSVLSSILLCTCPYRYLELLVLL